jgi:hypothetical protein
MINNSEQSAILREYFCGDALKVQFYERRGAS